MPFPPAPPVDASGRNLIGVTVADQLGAISLGVGNGLVPIATRTNSMTNGNRSQETSFGRMARVSHVAPNGAQTLRYLFANVADIGYGTAPNTNPVAIYHATEYPLGTAVPTTFGGKRVSIVEGGGIVTSDPVGITIPIGATFYERCYVAVPFPARSLAASAVAGGSLSGTYYYRVVSETDAGLSGVQASAVSVSPSGQAVALSWIDGNEILKTRAFHIYRGTASGSEKWIATVAPNALPGTFTPSVTATGTHTFVDTGLPASSVSTPATPYIS